MKLEWWLGAVADVTGVDKDDREVSTSWKKFADRTSDWGARITTHFFLSRRGFCNSVCYQSSFADWDTDPAAPVEAQRI